uniref:Uncharacterized protein n=1 Tax=Nomascus leucogenys TaxID=61853 RepID=A0A2I3HKT7_NOMLE
MAAPPLIMFSSYPNRTSALLLGVGVRPDWPLPVCQDPMGPSPPPVPTADFNSSFCVCHVNLLPGVLVSSVTSQYPHLNMALCQLALSFICV